MTYPTPGRPVRGSTSGRPIMALLDLLGRRWSMRILWELKQETASFRALQERCGQLSSSVLNTRLSELKAAALVALGDEGYRLTPAGHELMALIAPLRQWAEQWAGAADSEPDSEPDSEAN